MNISQTSFLTLSVFLLLCNSTFAEYCPGVEKPLDNTQKAKKCVQERFDNARADDLYDFAKKADHVGRTTDCEDDEPSYFSSKEDKFYTAVENINITSCKIDKYDDTIYRCIGTTTGAACYKKGVPTNNVTASINKDTANFVSFYPSKP